MSLGVENLLFAGNVYQKVSTPKVRVMLMKMLAPFSDPSATLGESTQIHLVDENCRLGRLKKAIHWVSLGGLELVSTGLVVGIGDIRKAISVTKQTIMAKSKPLTMAAAA